MPKLALVCLYPDWGHVKPLVGIAVEARRAGFDVRLFVPAKCAPLVEGFDATLLNIGVDTGPVFRALSRKSIFFLNFSGYSHTNLLIYPELIEQAADEYGPLTCAVQLFAPDLIVCDAHRFGDVYRRLGSFAPVLINDPSGTVGGLRRPFDRAFGPAPVPMKSVVEAFGWLHERVYRRAFYLRHWRRYLKLREAKRKLAAAMGDAPAVEPVATLSVGLGWVERELLPEGLGTDRNYFPPVSTATDPISPDLSEWLKTRDNVIYVSFGSLVALNPSDIAALTDALRRIGRPVIWSTRDNVSDPLFYVAPYVAQASLLRDPRVSLFITHGGASSVQEGLIAGVPMLCVPFFADQRYIASLVERLGVGLYAPKRRLGRLPIERMLNEPRYRVRAAEVARELAAAENGLGAFLLGYSPSRKPSESPPFRRVADATACVTAP